MAVFSIGAFSANYLTEQPYGYEGSARLGQTARRWMFDAILTTAQTTSLLTVYDTWRNARIQDTDTEVSGAAGTTVSLTCDSLIASVSALPCWFTKSPEIKTIGAYSQVTIELVDAAQAVEVVLRDLETARERSEPLLGTFGTYTLGSATLTLTRPADGFRDGPRVETLATGSHFVTGAKVVTKTKNIQGITNAAGWTNVQSWYETIIATTPAVDDWYPTAPPEATAEAVVDGGVKSTRYTVAVTLVQIR
jgi:hypothetical protein